PPNEVGIWAAFSVSNCGKIVPKQSASAEIANVSNVIVKTDTPKMKSFTCSIVSVTTTINNARINNGVVPTQNLAQSRSPMSSGLARSSHHVRPSKLTPGKMNRPATDAITNPATSRLQNGMTLRRTFETPSALSGRNFTLNT